MKELPSHLKYAYLGKDNTLPLIISTELSSEEEQRLVNVLEEYKEAIGWTIADIKGLSPSVMQKLLLEDDYKSFREAQRRHDGVSKKGDSKTPRCRYYLLNL